MFIKKFCIILFCTLFTACHQETTVTPTEQTPTENPHQHCADNSPLKNNTLPKIYWTFENENDKKCWYLGYINMNFFLTSEDDFLVAYATGTNLEETEWKKGEWEFFDGTYGNVLYGENYIDFIKKFQEDFHFERLQEIFSFHQYYINTIELFHEKLKQYHVTLPDNPIQQTYGQIHHFYQNHNIQEPKFLYKLLKTPK